LCLRVFVVRKRLICVNLRNPRITLSFSVFISVNLWFHFLLCVLCASAVRRFGFGRSIVRPYNR